MINKTAYIATFHCVPNYGAVLQAYGLQEYLASIFNKVCILDYRPDTLLNEYNAINFFSVGSIALSLLTLGPFLKKKRAFASFEKNLILSPISGKHIDDFSNLNTDYLFLGSDQIWNPNITHGFDPAYFGVFSMSKRPKIISYAASLGKDCFSKIELEQLNQLIKNVDMVSVREREVRELLLMKLNVKSTLVADPTILAGASVFSKLVKPVKYQNYLFLYTLTKNPITLQLANEIARKTGFQIIQVNGNRAFYQSHGHIVINDAGPEEFLSLLYNSSFVVTDSFHGTVFSNLFHIPYITVPHKTRGGRIASLLNELGMTNRLSETAKAYDEPINWDTVDFNLKRLQALSIEFINNSL